MSARGPFATVDEYRNVWVNGDVVTGSVIADHIAANLNAAHADRVAAELEAAAEMIEPSERKAGPGGPPGFVQGKEEGRILAAQHLRDRAKAIREGGGK